MRKKGKRGRQKQQIQRKKSININTVYAFFNIFASYSIIYWLTERWIYTFSRPIGMFIFFVSGLGLPVIFLIIEKNAYKRINEQCLEVQVLLAIGAIFAFGITFLCQLDRNFSIFQI